MDVQVQVHDPPTLRTDKDIPIISEQLKMKSDQSYSSNDSIESDEITTSDSDTPKNGSPEPSVLKKRKNKPPNLQISAQNKEGSIAQTTESPPSSDVSGSSIKIIDSSEIDSSSSPNSYVTLRQRMAKTTDAGLNSPVVKRTSRLEQILEIPDVKAALVKDEGYQMIRRRSYDNRMTTVPAKPCSGRLQTPAKQTVEEHFVFESAPAADIDSESVSGSDSSSLPSNYDAASLDLEKTVPNKPRPRIEPIRDVKDVFNPFERIADSTGPSSLFSGSSEKVSSPLSSPSTTDKKNKPDEVEDSPKTLRKHRAFFQKLKLSTLTRTGSSSSMEGWDSLARAMARVGASPTGIVGLDPDSFDVNPKLSPILKRRSHPDRWSSESSSSSQEPGTRATLRKKTVSFSRLPNENCVKNAADCVARMHEGHQFVKMRSNSRVYNRVYWLDEVSNCLRWEPSKKDAGKARIDISQIREVRPGKTTELFLMSDISAHFPDECSFSIIHGDGKTLDLISNSADDANVWITGLRCLMSGQDMEGLRMRPNARDNWLSSMFDGADANGDGYLDEDESLSLLKSLSDGIRELSIKQRLREYLKMRNNDHSKFSKDEFIEIFKDMATRPEVYFLLARYATKDDQLSVDDLLVFLESEQGQSHVTKEDCLNIINQFEPSEFLRSIPALGIDGFTKYLISSDCTIFDPKHLQVCQDMNQPLSHYFIASSHNTYLMEDQLTGPSNVSAYERALLRCCRCVELDCWDGPNDSPVVAHGHTRTNSIPFRQVIEAIKKTAFHNSPYPVIICIENHCSTDQQVAMATTLKEVLGDMIYNQGLAKEATLLPSPTALKHRFLIRARKLRSESSGDVGYVSDEDEGREIIDKVPASPHSPAELMIRSPEREDGRHPLVRELSDLVSLCATVTMKDDFDSFRSTYNCCHSCSLHENNAFKLVETVPEDFVAHTKKYLTRVFPSAGRLESSNFNPQDFWNCGVQMASLNYQTPGLMMDINDGKFSMNGGCGYVLKPAIMRDPLAYYNTHARDVIPGTVPKNFHVRIISGQNFPKPRGGGAKGHVIDPYVLIELFGIPSDCAEQRTRTAPNNSGGSPIFDEPFEFKIALPSLALVRFVVLDDDFIGDEFIGQFTIPFECLQPGYRHLRLRSIFDEPLENATLFVHIAVTEADYAFSSSGNITPVSTGTPPVRSSSKRSSSQKRLRKTRSRKDSDVIQLLDIHQPAVDELFRAANEPLHLAAMLRGSQRWSLSYFRETCGVNALASVKQCIRALGQRHRADAAFPEGAALTRSKRKLSSAPDLDEADESVKQERRRRAISTDGGQARLRRQASDTSSQSSVECNVSVPSQVSLIRKDRKLSLHLRGLAASNESWRKASLALDALMNDTFEILHKAKNCVSSLDSIYEKAVELYDDLPLLLSNGNHVAIEGGSDVNGVSNGTTIKKSSKSKKKQTFSLDYERGRQQTAEENFRWNCSVIKGQTDLLMTSYSEIDAFLDDAWEAGLHCGLADADDSSQLDSSSISNGIDSDLVSTNDNGNNNKPPATSRNGRGATSVPFFRMTSTSHMTPSRPSSAARKLNKRSLSSDAFPFTLL